jgi:hypothetical protein
MHQSLPLLLRAQSMNPKPPLEKTIKRLHIRKYYNLPIYGLLPMGVYAN